MRLHVSMYTRDAVQRALQNKDLMQLQDGDRVEELLEANNVLKIYDCIQMQTSFPGKVTSC